MLSKIRNFIGEFRAYNRERKQVVRATALHKKEQLKGRIVRYVHSIEKGLSIESPRPEFGYEKIQTLYAWIKEYIELEKTDKTCIYMAADALSTYCAYHDSIGVYTDKIKEIKAIAAELSAIKIDDGVEGAFGGVQILKKEDLVFDQATVERLFKTRHSIRQFNKEPVDEELIRKAISLAQMAPSACNRQAVRAYSINAQKFLATYPANLQGIGGFVDSCDKIIIITGKISSYEESEYKQFVVSAGIFVGYLSLALHALGLGACVVQRSLRPNEEWSEFCEKNNIPSDEQIVCLLTVGQMNDQTLVPVSKRFDTETIFRCL